jgi:hypothetical protein
MQNSSATSSQFNVVVAGGETTVDILPSKIINELKTKPLDNLPIYTGRRTIKV